MLRRIVQRFRAAAAYRENHKRAFLAESTRKESGETEFQQLCVELITETFPQLEFKPDKHEDGTLMLIAELPATNEQIYVYENEAGIFGSAASEPLEEWSFSTPAELRANLVRALHRRFSPMSRG